MQIKLISDDGIKSAIITKNKAPLFDWKIELFAHEEKKEEDLHFRYSDAFLLVLNWFGAM